MSDANAQARSTNVRPCAFDVQVGLWAAAFWCLSFAPSFTRNGVLSDALLLAGHAFVYACFWLGLCWLVRVGAGAAAARVRAAAARVRPAAADRIGRAVAGASVFGATGVLLLAPDAWGRALSLALAVPPLAVITVLAAPRLPAAPHALTRGAAWLSVLLVLVGFSTWRAATADEPPAPEWAGAPGAGAPESGPPESEDRAPSNVRLLALDGLDLALAMQLVSSVPLPNLRRMIEAGAVAELTTISPRSPVVWTSIATGMPPETHGVKSYTSSYFRGTSLTAPELEGDFLGRLLGAVIELREEAPVSSNERRVKSLWEVFADLEVESLVVNWWATYPAEPISGIVISQHAVPWEAFREPDVARLEATSRLVWPAELQPGVMRALRSFIDEEQTHELERNAFSAEGSRFFDARDDLMFSLYERYLEPSTRFATVYLQGIDTSSHAFTEIVFGRNINRVRPMQVVRSEAERWWQELVLRAYARMDEKLGRALERLGERDCLIVISDHGWQYDGTSHWRLPPSAFLAYGRMVEPGTVVRGAHVYDVLPTLAWLLDVPVSRELPGRILEEAFTHDYRAANRASYVDGYGPRGRRLSAARVSDDDAHLDRLRDLGYIE